MSQNTSDCIHVTNVGVNTWAHIYRKKQICEGCDTCGSKGPNLWLCLHSGCLYVGCGESAVDHSSTHAEEKEHCLTLNMTTMRVWCYQCEMEVQKDSNEPPLIMGQDHGMSTGPIPPLSHTSLPPTSFPTPMRSPTPPQEESDSDDDDDSHKPRGLTGLQNIGNTCYLNSAIQALSNCPPLTRYFLDCRGFVKTEKKPQLCKAYSKLMGDVWHKKRPSYVVPSSVVHGIKLVHPMFRGFSQQDSQEFLRCFMDQIHEELKQPITTGSQKPMEEEAVSDQEDDKNPTECDTLVTITSEGNNPSDTDYETCESGVNSEQSSVEHSVSSGDDASLESGEMLSRHTKLKACSESLGSTSCIKGDEDDRESTSERDSGVESCTVCSEDSSSTISHDGSRGNCKANKETTNLSLVNKNTYSPSKESCIKHTNDSLKESESLEFIDAVCELEPLHSGPTSQKIAHIGNKTAAIPKPRARVRTESDKSRVASLRGSSKKKKTLQYRSVISDIFDGKILSSVQCLTCERISSTRETFQDLSLPIPSKDHLHMLHAQHSGAPAMHKGTCGEVSLRQGWFSWMFSWMKGWFWGPTITLQDCLAAFFSADELKGDNMYSCEKCKKLRNGVKYSKVLELPEILCVHLKRFRHEFMFSSKISTYVAFPLEGLDMGPYLHKDLKSNQLTVYDLVAVICHHGTAGGGHYTSYALNYLNEQWYEFDDQFVTEVDMQQVENCEAYVLFYRKRNEDILPVRQKASQIMESQDNESFMKFYISRSWINEFNTFSKPGPISNHDFLCCHGGVAPNRWANIGELVEEVPQKLWEFLHEKFGGGPAVNHLYQCSTCVAELEKLRRRQSKEMETFLQLHQDFQNEDYDGQIFAIGMQWFKEWENFVRGRIDEPPGPIDNAKISGTKAGQMMLRPNSDYGQLSGELWEFLFSCYGGGPTLPLKPSKQPSPPTSPQTSAAAVASKADDGSGDTVKV